MYVSYYIACHESKISMHPAGTLKHFSLDVHVVVLRDDLTCSFCHACYKDPGLAASLNDPKFSARFGNPLK